MSLEIKFPQEIANMVSTRTNTYLDNWWKKEVEPINKMLRDAVEVHSHMRSGEVCWAEKGFAKDATHRAYLIGIEPIKKETAEDVLRDYIRRCESDESGSMDVTDIIERAKRVLENEE